MDLVWPSSAELSTVVPKRIREIYDEAISVKHAPNAFANQIRRALEAVCRDRDADADNLHNMLGKLSTQNEIPEKLSEMTGLLRKLGNAGSHDKKFDVDSSFVEAIDDFFRTVVRYVYVMQEEISRVEREFENAQSREKQE
jgi:hypothetical protein